MSEVFWIPGSIPKREPENQYVWISLSCGIFTDLSPLSIGLVGKQYSLRSDRILSLQVVVVQQVDLVYLTKLIKLMEWKCFIFKLIEQLSCFNHIRGYNCEQMC